MRLLQTAASRLTVFFRTHVSHVNVTLHLKALQCDGLHSGMAELVKLIESSRKVAIHDMFSNFLAFVPSQCSAQWERGCRPKLGLRRCVAFSVAGHSFSKNKP